MSDFLAIATVSAVLRRTLQAAVDVDVPGAKVATGRPKDPTTSTDPGINVYLVQATANAALRNADLPTIDSPGRLVERPRAALDLDFILTFFGDETTLEPQRLMGSAVRALEERPVLTPRMIRETVADPAFASLATSDLAAANERVKIMLHSLSLEDLSKLWSIFFQVPHTLSLAYRATVVEIEGRDAPRTPLPVLDYNLYVAPFEQPLVEGIESQTGADEPITAASTLVIRGRRLKGEMTRVRIAGEEVTPAAVTAERIVLPLSAVPAGKLRAGVQGLQVVHPRLMGTPPISHRGVESNVAAFVVRPTITARDVKNAQQPTGETRFDADVEIQLAARVGKTQRVRLLLDEADPPSPDVRPARAYTFDAPDRNLPGADESTDTIVVPITKVHSADYLLRIEVDGAQSLLLRDTVEASATFNRFIGPRESVP